MHVKSGLRVVLKWKIFRPDSVIAAVIQLGAEQIEGSNPYKTPMGSSSLDQAVGERRRWFESKPISWTLFLSAFVMVIFSLEDGWIALQILNREHWQLWPSSSIRVGELSPNEAIQYSFRFMLTIWILAGLLIWVSRWIYPSRQQKMKRNSNSVPNEMAKT